MAGLLPAQIVLAGVEVFLMPCFDRFGSFSLPAFEIFEIRAAKSTPDLLDMKRNVLAVLGTERIEQITSQLLA